MSLVTLAEARALVQTGLTDANLQVIIDRIEAEIVRLFGAHYTNGAGTITETVAGEGLMNLYLRRPLTSVSSVVEDDEALTQGHDEDYYAYPAQGRIERRPSGTKWGELIAVTYVPADDNALRRDVIIDLLRQALSRTALKSESVAGEYSYTAEDWELARAEIIRRLGFAM